MKTSLYSSTPSILWKIKGSRGFSRLKETKRHDNQMPGMLLTWIWIGENWKRTFLGQLKKLEDKLYTVNFIILVLNVLAYNDNRVVLQWLKMSLFLKILHTISLHFTFKWFKDLVKEVIWRSPNVKNWWLYMKG